LTPPLGSETTPEGRKITKLDQILLNGNNITMLVPGGEYPVINLMELDVRSQKSRLDDSLVVEGSQILLEATSQHLDFI